MIFAKLFDTRTTFRSRINNRTLVWAVVKDKNTVAGRVQLISSPYTMENSLANAKKGDTSRIKIRMPAIIMAEAVCYSCRLLWSQNCYKQINTNQSGEFIMQTGNCDTIVRGNEQNKTKSKKAQKKELTTWRDTNK